MSPAPDEPCTGAARGLARGVVVPSGLSVPTCWAALTGRRRSPGIDGRGPWIGRGTGGGARLVAQLSEDGFAGRRSIFVLVAVAEGIGDGARVGRPEGIARIRAGFYVGVGQTRKRVGGVQTRRLGLCLLEPEH